jgi:acid stress-induced BolA-like protein IbaG/YrbA
VPKTPTKVPRSRDFRTQLPFPTQKPDMPITAADIHQLITAALPDAHIEVQGDDGVHFEARVVSPSFQGKLPLARHRMVYASLGDRMGSEIHALALKTLTPSEAGLKPATP